MKIGLMGFGTIGSGVYELAAKRDDLSVERVLDLRSFPELGDKLTADFEDILNDASIDTVVELMGGVQPAFGFLSRCLAAGKNAVTANKLMLSYHLADLLDIAQKSGAKLKIDASVGGGIPYLYNLIRTKRADTITAVHGIVNGTTNLILDTMQSEGADFADVLAAAQRAGYAEANPAADIDGIDARSKLCITSSLAFGAFVHPDDVAMTGIRQITKEDVDVFKARGYVCRLLVRGSRFADGAIAAYVEPTLLDPAALEANVCKNDNLVGWDCVNGGCQFFFGQGAGKEPTATTVLLGLDDILRGEELMGGCVPQGKAVVDNSRVAHRYYVRTTAMLDIPAEKLADNIYLTEAVCVDKMHALAATLRQSDPNLFFAGIREEQA